MSGSWQPSDLPNLTSTNHVVTSPFKARYNCIAWAAGNDTRWWWPVGRYYWPPNVPRVETLDAFIAAFATLGFVECADALLEANFEKIAIYAVPGPGGAFTPTHGARQLPDGKWTSKLGPFEDITHDTLDDVNCFDYGFAVKFMKRPR
jgi:hypothetical protein